MSNPEFLIDRLSLSGIDSEFITGEAEAIPSDSSDTDYDEPYAYVSFTINGVFVELESESLEFRPQIGALGMDGEGRLWVRIGTTDDEKWLLYSSDGEFCSTGTITGIPETGRLRYVVNEFGAVVWAPYTEDYPVLYVLCLSCADAELIQRSAELSISVIVSGRQTIPISASRYWAE